MEDVQTEANFYGIDLHVNKTPISDLFLTPEQLKKLLRRQSIDCENSNGQFCTVEIYCDRYSRRLLYVSLDNYVYISEKTTNRIAPPKSITKSTARFAKCLQT